MKKIISFALALMLIMSLTACGQNSAESSSRTPESSTDQTKTSTKAPVPGNTDPVEASSQTPADTKADQTEASTKAPETTAPATTEEAVVKKDLSVDEVGLINVPHSKGSFRSAAVILMSNPSSGITYDRVKLTVSFYDEKDNFMEAVKYRLTPAVRPGDQVPFRVDCTEKYTLKAARAEVNIDSFETLDNKQLQREIDGKRVSLVDDGTLFELTKQNFTRKSTGKFRIDFTVKNKNAEKEKCYVFFIFRKDGKIVYGQEAMLYVNGSSSKDDYFYANHEDSKDFPDYDEVVTVLINGH